MRNSGLIILIMTLILFSFYAAPRAETSVKSYREDFKSARYLDSGRTSASWDTLRGEIKLPPYQINLVGGTFTVDASWGIYQEGDSVYVADGYSGIHLIDISDPTNLRIRNTYDRLEGEAHSIDVAGDSIYVALGSEGYAIVNKRFILQSAPSPTKDSGDPLLSGSPPGDSRIFDYIDPSRDILTQQDLEPFTFDLEVAKDSLLVLADWDSLKIVKVKSSIFQQLRTVYDGRETPGGAIDLDIIGNNIYVSNYNSGLEIVYFWDCDSLIGSCETPGQSYGFDISGDYLYMADSDEGLQVIDISNPRSPVIVGSFDTPGYAVNVTVSGDYAYVADWEHGITVVDVSNPATPVQAGTSPVETGFSAVNWPWDVIVSGDYAFVAAHSSGVRVLQIFPFAYELDSYQCQSKPVNPNGEDINSVKMETSQEDGVSWEVSADGGAHWQELTPDNSWQDLTVPGNSLVWRSTHRYSGDMSIARCSLMELSYQSEVATLLTASSASFQGGGVKLQWSVSDLPEECVFAIYRSIYPIENFERISVIEARPGPDHTFKDTELKDGETYHYRVSLIDEAGEKILFSSSAVSVPESALALHQNKPNPFNPSTTIGYDLPDRTHVILDVYDVSGRHVRNLVDEVKDEGSYSAVWNGKDYSGNTVSSGVYFYVLNTGKRSFTRKMVLLR